MKGIGIAGILGKTCLFPLISVHLSRALGWPVRVNGGGLVGLGEKMVVLTGWREDLGERYLGVVPTCHPPEQDGFLGPVSSTG